MANSLFETTYNPDVLTCLANLSNDEVFTPPTVVNDMLDMLPQEIFQDPNTKFLDPVCKSGVFLREIAKRLIKGLENQIPDLQERLEHIFQNQLFGIAITELTSLLSRRSLYCSKWASSKYSVVKFHGIQGNIRYKALEHRFLNGKCVYCGASEKTFGPKIRPAGAESHAYEFIHTTKPEEILNMKFDVIIGNPPYQMSDGGAQKSASPIYQLFIQQAIKLSPRYLSMIVPARWYAGGKGLDEFRSQFLKDQRLCQIHDFPETSDCFPGVNIRGGVCYFLWDRSHKGDCRVVTHKRSEIVDEQTRPLLEPGAEMFIRYNTGIKILQKIRAHKEGSFADLVSSSKPFGLRGFFSDYSDAPTATRNIKLYRFGTPGYISPSQIEKNASWINKPKVIVAEASPGGDDYPHLVLSRPLLCEAGAACTETYLVIGPTKSEEEARNIISYMYTQLFRFLIILIKNTQHTTKKVYQFVPMQDFSHPWTDQMLYEKYGITEEEIAFINSLVKPLRKTDE